MPKCPKCEKEIGRLYRFRQPSIDAVLSVNDSGEVTVSPPDQFQMQDPEEFEYTCPKCGETVTEDGEEASRFLKGEEI